jgi:hypothetical protein
MSVTAYERPLLVVAERKANITEAEKGSKGGHFCRCCDSEIVLTASSQQRIASRSNSTLLCVQCFRSDPVLTSKLWMNELAG